MRAWLRLASPLMTLMKSKTTRRSHPMTRSRLRRPTSKSMTTVFLPFIANPAATAAEVVVLPTPPLPEVTTITCAKDPSSHRPSAASIAEDYHMLVIEHDLCRPAQMFRRDLVADEIAAGNADELGFQALDEDARRAVAGGAGDRPPAQGAVNMNVPVGDDLGAGAHRFEDDEVAAARVDLGARAHRLGNQHRSRRARRWARSRLGRRGAVEAAESRLGRRLALRRVRVLNPDRDEVEPAQQALQLGEIRGRGEPLAVLEVEHHRRLGEELRRAPDLRAQGLLEIGKAGLAETEHHDGE